MPKHYIVAGNWKMHGSRASVRQLLTAIKAGVERDARVTVIVFPSFVFLEQVEQSLTGSSIQWGGQNLNTESQGAFTGEVSGAMLADFHCHYVLIGHSERRLLYGESDKIVAKKFLAAKQAGLIPVLCVGETLAQRQQGQTRHIIQQQLQTILELPGGIELLQNAVIAYEPVWAIGTGLTASPEQAQEVHAAIREQLANDNKEIAAKLSILYGGSVKAGNAQELFAMPDINGSLIGGASLDAEEFLTIYRIAVGK